MGCPFCMYTGRSSVNRFFSWAFCPFPFGATAILYLRSKRVAKPVQGLTLLYFHFF